MTQHQLILLYVQENAEIIPAKMNGKSYMGGFFGSETSRRCRELRKEGKLRSEGYGRFEKFYLPGNKSQTLEEGQVLSIWEQEKKLEDLRIKWREETDPVLKGVIERQGKAIKTAIEMAKNDPEAKQVLESIF